MKKSDTFVDGLTTILAKNKVIKPEEATAMKKAFHESEKPEFDEFLLQEGLVQESDLLKALSQYYQVPAFDVLGYLFRHHLITMFPKDFLLREAVIPLEVDNNILSVVASNPSKPGLESALREYVSYDIAFRVGLKRDIGDAVQEFYDQAINIIPTLSDLEQEERIKEQAETEKDMTEPIIGDQD